MGVYLGLGKKLTSCHIFRAIYREVQYLYDEVEGNLILSLYREREREREKMRESKFSGGRQASHKWQHPPGPKNSPCCLLGVAMTT